MDTEDALLIECVAEAAALFEPIRDCMASHWPATWVLRWRFKELGLPLRTGGLKSNERALKKLVDDGMIATRQAHRTVAWRPTLAGQERVWGLCDRDPGQGLSVARDVAELGPGGEWVSELAFLDRCGDFGADDPTKRMKAVAWHFAPALVAQWIESNCTVRGSVAYRLTKPGVSAVTGYTPGPHPDACPDARPAYENAYKSMLRWLDALTASKIGHRGEIGEVPLIEGNLTCVPAKPKKPKAKGVKK